MKRLGVPNDGVTRETIMLRWVVSDGVNGYQVERARSGRELVAIGAVPGPSFLDHDLDPNTRYVYRVTELRPDDYVPTDDDDVPVMRTGAMTLPELEFATSGEFFTEFLSVSFARKYDTVAWCDRWFEHPEAALVVGELWNSYEASRPLDPPAPPDGGRMAWLVHYAYPALDRLFQKDGTFTGCGYKNAGDGGLDSWHRSPMGSKPLPG